MPPPGVDVVIVDDHHLFTRGLVLLLDAAADGRIRVTGTTADGNRAVTLVRSTAPDVALIDLAMPPPGGLAVIGAVKRAVPDVRVLALSGGAGTHGPIEALEAGADGCLPKTAEPDELLYPLISLLCGWAVIPTWLLADLLHRGRRPRSGLVDRLDAGQQSLWRAVARGCDTQTIAREHHVSERTAKRMTARLLHDLGVGSRIEAAALAGRCGLLD